MRRLFTFSAVAALSIAGLGVSTAAQAAPPKRIPAYKNCLALNKAYPHGIGKRGARDKVARGKRPVTNFLVHNQGYQANAKRLDRDKDGIACEKP